MAGPFIKVTNLDGQRAREDAWVNVATIAYVTSIEKDGESTGLIYFAVTDQSRGGYALPMRVAETAEQVMSAIVEAQDKGLHVVTAAGIDPNIGQ